MKWLLWLLAAFALAVGLSFAMRGNEGYALFVLPPWRVEMSLAMLTFVLAAAFAGGYFLVRFVSHTLHLPSHVRAFRERRRENRGRAAVLGAIQALYEGRFVRAEKLAAEACELEATPELASLIAARAAQRLREFGRRDRWLDRAKDHKGDWGLARSMTVAELLLEERRFDDARRVLQELRASGPKHVAILTLLLRAEQGLGNWEEVLRIAKLLDKHAAMPAEVVENIRINARVALLAQESGDAVALGRHWRDVPEAERTHARVAAAAARAFIRLRDCRAAHRIIEKALEREWHAGLVLLYGECSDDSLESLEQAESWLLERPEDAELLLTLGRLCVGRELWGKAQSYFEASLATRPTQAAHAALANLFERVGRTADAQRHFRASAEFPEAPRQTP
jgi:HemY protein